MNSVERVKELCKEKKIPISKLERDLDFANGYIGQLKKGNFPDDRIIKIANYLDVSVNYLMGVDEEENQESNMRDSVLKAENKIEEDMLLLCRKVNDAPEEDREEILKHFKSSVDLYLKAKGIKGEG